METAALAAAVMATAIAMTAGMGASAVAATAEEELAITVPVGLVVEDLVKSDLAGDILIEGCADGSSLIDLFYSPLDRGDDPGPSLRDVFLVPDDDGVTRLPVQTVSSWFSSTTRPPGGEVEITVECDTAGDRTYALAAIESMGLRVVVPAGMTVATLRAAAVPSAVTIEGCTGGAVSAQFSYAYPLGPGAPDVSTPIVLVPPVETVDSSVSIPLAAVSEWLRLNVPEAVEEERIIVAAQCVGRDRAEGVIPSDLAVVPEIPDTEPLPDGEPLPEVAPVPGSATGSPQQGRPLPATG
ncbi:hypothetical protein QSU92_10365 [Microbacterium sp. ET2]|uniref:hypothetical protein n=1 Tax=Microbacterium albipurpureum TaxID=3050384 RepID=UPI00259CD10D|nr:hypothetical protein [Microbacterium sp. ET2 (Ac-2212)]WJL94386.1 hypothetical protein QSU92_10365 [Microbacterium sp. ET2 (Ac-2212)]